MPLNENNDNHNKDDFFLPNLCSGPSLFFLVVVAELLILSLEIYESDLPNFDWIGFGETSLFTFWVILPVAALLCNLRNVLKQWPRWLAAMACFVLLLVFTAIASVLSQWVGLSPQVSGTNEMLLLKHLFLASIFGGIILRYVFLQEQLRRKQQAELKARIAALQARIHPHFLFNSMNIITSLIETDPATAEQVVIDLSELFRASLADGEQTILFKDEQILCERYLQIEKLRLGERLEVEWNIDPLLLGVSIPSLMLQPLLENAVNHGIQPLNEGGRIVITGEIKDHWCEVTVVNPIPDNMENSRHTGNKMAVENIRARLLALYGSTASLVLHQTNGYFVAKIRYPYEQVTVDKGSKV